MSQNPRVQYHCSFCGKSQEQVHRLIAGPGGVYICDECIELCREIITDERKGPRQSPEQEISGRVMDLHIRVDDLEHAVLDVDVRISPDSPLFGSSATPEVWSQLVSLLIGVIQKLPPDKE